MKERYVMNEKNFRHKAWSQMPTQQLDKALQQELRKEDPEEEVVLGILRVLEEREADYPFAIDQKVSDAWDKYRKQTTPAKKSSRRHLWLLCAAVAAMLCIVLMAVPQTVGAQSVFDVFFRWTESIFEFFTPGQDVPKPTTAYVFQTDHPGLRQVYEEVTAYGETEPVVPMWVPEGYELMEVKTIQMLDGVKIYARLQQEESVIFLTYRVSSEIVVPQHEKEDIDADPYECSGVDHFIVVNDNDISVTWKVDGTECALSTDIEKEGVYKIIQSIYWRKLS